MNKIKVKLPVNQHDDYGDSLNIGDKTVEVEKTKAVETLLRAGALVPVSQPQKRKTTGGKKSPIILNIKGIGKETLSDINKIFTSEEELIFALKNDKVPLRNDVVKSLERFYKINFKKFNQKVK